MDTSYLAQSLSGGHTPDLKTFDLNHDGFITADDCPFPAGSVKAKLWYQNVMEPYAKSQVTKEMKDKYGEKVVGSYMGKPLVPGEVGQDHGDFQFLVDKLVITEGLSPSSATKIAGKIKDAYYGNGITKEVDND